MSRRTIFLARLFGLFITITAVWMLVDEPGLKAGVEDLVHDRPATFLLSLMCLGAGLAVVLGHQVWSGGIAPILVTIIGWILVARGLLLLFLPSDQLQALVDAALGAAWGWLAGIAALIVGVFLTYAGFRAPPIVSGGQ